MFHSMEDLSVVIPSYNENHEILRKLEKQLEDLGIEVIIVEDGSSDPYPNAVCHASNIGYGQALMTGISKAKRPLILTMDGDGQHNVGDVIKLYTVWKMLDVDMLVGARRLRNEKFIRMFGRKFLNLIASFFAFMWLPDLNSGMRLFKRKVAMDYFQILCKQFSFTTSLTMSMMCDNLHVEWFPISVEERKHGVSRVKVIRHGLITLWYILYIGFAIRTRGIRAWLRSLRSI